MPDLLLLDWDTQEARVLACSREDSTLRVRHTESAAIEGEVSAASLIAAFTPLLKKISGSRSKATIVLGGRDLQTRLMRIPPVPPEEVPEMVRLKSSTEFSTSDETAIVDFLALSESADEPSTMFVARTAENRLELARQVAAKLQFSLQHLTSRGAGIASLAVRAASELASGTHLVAARRGSEVDLVGVCDGQVASVRSVPLSQSGDQAAQAAVVAREFRRTIAALAGELDTTNIESIVWLTSDDEDQALADRCGEALSRSVTVLDLASLSWLKLESDTEHLSRFAGLLGTALVADDSPAIDFLAPRKAPKQEKPIRTYALAAAFGLLVLLGGGWLIYDSVVSVEAQAERNSEEIKSIKDKLDDLTNELKQHKEIEGWLATDVNWLDELDRIATTIRKQPLSNHEDFDEAGDVMLTSIIASQTPGRTGVGGNISLTGVVRDDSVVEEIEQQLSGPGRQVTQKDLSKNEDQQPYIWTFKGDIVVPGYKEDRR